MRRVLLCLIPALVACAPGPERYEIRLVTDGPMPEISVEGSSAPFTLRPGLSLPERRNVMWGGRSFTLRLLEDGSELPYPPLPGTDGRELVYANMALVGGTDDPREALIVMLVQCRGGYDPITPTNMSMPARYAPTGEWVFDVDGSLCDRG